MVDVIERNSIWLGQIAIILIGVVIVNAIVRHMIANVITRIDADKNYWQLSLLRVIRRYATWIAWLVAISFCLQIVYQQTNMTALSYYSIVRNVGVMMTLAWGLFQFIHLVTDDFIRVRKLRGIVIDVTTADAIRKLLQALVLIIASLIILQDLGFSVSGVMAIGGVGGIVIGLAAKDLLANFFGGLMIYLDRPFQVGDTIRSPDREIEGKVEKIGWRLTTLRTPDKRPLYVPNATFTSITVENPSRIVHRRIHEFIGLRYQDAKLLVPVLDELRTYFKSQSFVDQNEPVLVNLYRFGPSSIDIELSICVSVVEYPQFAETRQNVLFKILQIVQSNGAEIAFPTTTFRTELPIKVSIATT